MPPLADTECNSPGTRLCNFQITFVLLSGGVFCVQLLVVKSEIEQSASGGAADSTNYIQPFNGASPMAECVKTQASLSLEIKAGLDGEHRLNFSFLLHMEKNKDIWRHNVQRTWKSKSLILWISFYQSISCLNSVHLLLIQIYICGILAPMKLHLSENLLLLTYFKFKM